MLYDYNFEILPTVLNDGTILNDNIDMFEYLTALGIDINVLATVFAENFGKVNKDYVKRDEVDDWERYYDGAMNAYQNLKEEIFAMNKTFLSGRKLTKAQYVRKLEDMLDNDLEY